MKRWQTLILVAAGLAVAGYVYYTRYGATFTFLGGHATSSGDSATGAPTGLGHPARMDWRTLNRPDDGFTVEMPAEARELQVPAYNEAGSTEPVKMLSANPDGETTFAITWADNPPVSRVSGGTPERTLDMARDGMLRRTQTTLSNETRSMLAGFPSRTISAQNVGGGVLDARLILTGERLYTLMALYPSSSARREQDVTRFFNSFAPSRLPGTSLPPATMK